jgi:Cu-Zn family superoxide dismutase
MLRRRSVLLIVLLIGFSLSLAQVSAAPNAKSIEASIVDVSGGTIGRVVFSHNETGHLVVEVEVTDLEPGFHGFHVHSVGECDASGDQPFSSAGDLMIRAGRAPSENIGEMPPLFVMVDGSARMMFETDTFDLGHLLDKDGAAVIIHAVSENSEDTLVSDSGDEETEGDRVACAVFGVE